MKGHYTIRHMFLETHLATGQVKGSSTEMNAQVNWSKTRSFSISALMGIGTRAPDQLSHRGQ